MSFIAHPYLNIEKISPNQVICHGFKDGMTSDIIDIPDGVTEIADYAFCTDNEGIIRVHCPESLTKIGTEAFQCCENLKEIHLPKTMCGVLADTFGGCSRLRRLVIPEGITEITPKTFNDCENLEEIVIPDTVIRIGYGAFYSCDALTCLYIPDSVKELSMPGTFEFCRKLEKVRLPQNIRFTWEPDCGRVLFNDCPSLHTIEIGEQTFSFDVERFKRFYDIMEDTNRPWSDEEMKAVLVDCCIPEDHKMLPAYKVSQKCLNQIRMLAKDR